MPEHVRLTPETLAAAAVEAGRVLRSGGVALLPAEGVYGLHARADLPAAMARLRAIKRRDPGKGLIGLLATPSAVGTWCGAIPAGARALIEAHWPGALTIVFRAGAAVPRELLAPDGTVALRCPGSAFLRAAVLAAGGIVASTSANLEGEPPALTAEGPIAAQTDLVVDAGRLSGLPSTVVAVEEDFVRVLREGAVRIGPGRP